MRFIKSFTAVVAAMAGLAMAKPLPATMEKRNAGAVCTDPNFANVTFVGNSSGTPFCESQWGTTYFPINTLITWWNSSYVLGIQAIYSDGSQSPVYGITDGLTKTSISVNYANASDDTFKTLNLYKYDYYPYINALYVVTEDGTTMNAGESIYFFPPQYTQDVGAGVLYGFSGTIDPRNGYINSLGFEFLDSKIVEVDVTNFRFGDLPRNNEDILPMQVGTAHYYNNQSNGNQMWTFQNTYSHTVTFTFEQQYTETIMASEAILVEYMGQVPVPVSVGSTTTFGWTLSAMQDFTNTNTNVTQVQWQESGSLSPHTGVTCVATLGIGSGQFPYNSTVTVHLQNGKSFHFEQSGTLKLNDVTDVVVDCGDDNNP